MPYPDFICVGAQKAGTTWLYQQMLRHKELWLPPVKELHYFDIKGSKAYIHWAVKPTMRGNFVRHQVRRWLFREDPGWTWSFLMKSRTISNYQQLFRPAQGQLAGEITPAYAVMPEAQIKTMAAAMPNTKIIYLLRNPIDRLWSQVNMFKRQHSDKQHYTIPEILDYKGDIMFHHGAYHSNLQRWQSAFGADQVHVRYYEELQQEPIQMLTAIYTYLGVSTDADCFDESINKVYNGGQYKSTVPAELEYMITRRMLPELEGIHEQLQSPYTQAWLDRAQRVLALASG